MNFRGVMAEFADETSLLRAARLAWLLGYRQMDAFTPYPVEGLAEAMGKKGSWLPLICLVAGLCGGGGGYFMLWLSMGKLYPLNIGGRPLHSWPAFIPVTFELTILCAALAGVVALFFITRLPRLHHPVFGVEGFERASDDRFFLWIGEGDPFFQTEATRQWLEEQGALRVIAVHGEERRVHA